VSHPASRTKREFRARMAATGNTRLPAEAPRGAFGKDREPVDRSRRSKPHDYTSRVPRFIVQ